MGVAASSLMVQACVELNMSMFSERGGADALWVGRGLPWWTGHKTEQGHHTGHPLNLLHELQRRETWKQLRK